MFTPGFRILDLDFFLYWIRDPNPGSRGKKAPDPGSATLLYPYRNPCLHMQRQIGKFEDNVVKVCLLRNGKMPVYGTRIQCFGSPFVSMLNPIRIHDFCSLHSLWSVLYGTSPVCIIQFSSLKSNFTYLLKPERKTIAFGIRRISLKGYIQWCPASQVKKTKVQPDYSSAPTQLAMCLRLAY
jgi:hypothetical protein